MRSETISYQSGDKNFIGKAFSPEGTGPHPVVLVGHAWGGRAAFEDGQAEKLAELGYIAFAMDVYGDGKLGENNDENASLMMPLLEDRIELSRRTDAALQAALALKGADASRVAGIGYCFGGLTVLDMARRDAPLRGVVAYHANLALYPSPTAKTNCKVLVLNGDADPMVPAEQVMAFMEDMNDAGIDWQFHNYGHAKHSFTKPTANYPELGMVYDEKAARRSWQSTQNFLQEIFD